MSPAKIQVLREVNHNLRSGLARLKAQRSRPSSITRRDLTDLLAELRRAVAGLSAEACTPDADMDKETAEYRTNLEALSNLLQPLGGGLLVEKARLQTAQTRLAAATAWALTDRKTL